MITIRQVIRMPDTTIDMLTCTACEWIFPDKTVLPCPDHGTTLRPVT